MSKADLAAERFEPVKGQRLSSLVAEQLQRAILSGEYGEGDRLPSERALIERFGVSRASILEAMRVLETMGLVTIRRGINGGAFVAKPDFTKVSNMLQGMLWANRFDVEDLYKARLLIEPGTAEIAARVATPEDIASLRDSIEFRRRQSARQDLPGGIGRNFHYLLATITRNPLLVMLVSSLLGVAQAARVRQPRHALAERLRAQSEIVDAIERGDGGAARELLESHINQMLRDVSRAED